MTPGDVVRPKRGRESIGDMVRSLGLIAVVIAATLIFVPGLIHPSKSQRFRGVDYTDYLVGFRQLTGRYALKPVSLPYAWKPNAADLTGTKSTAHLHIGWATPGETYAALEESLASPTQFVPSVIGVSMTAATGSVMIGNSAWQTAKSSRGEFSMIRTSRGMTVVITGSATDEQLELLAASLR